MFQLIFILKSLLGADCSRRRKVVVLPERNQHLIAKHCQSSQLNHSPGDPKGVHGQLQLCKEPNCVSSAARPSLFCRFWPQALHEGGACTNSCMFGSSLTQGCYHFSLKFFVEFFFGWFYDSVLCINVFCLCYYKFRLYVCLFSLFTLLQWIVFTGEVTRNSKKSYKFVWNA